MDGNPGIPGVPGLFGLPGCELRPMIDAMLDARDPRRLLRAMRALTNAIYEGSVTVLSLGLQVCLESRLESQIAAACGRLEV